MTRNIHINLFVLVAVLALGLFLAGCSSQETRPSGQYVSIKIAEGVEGVPGTVAWSPDGRYLAFLMKGKLYFHDIGSGSTEAIGLKHTSYLVWLDGGELAALGKTGSDSTPTLTLMDVRSGKKREVVLPQGTVAVHPTWSRSCLLALTSERKATRIGVEARYEMYCIDLNETASEKKYEVARIVQGSASDMSAFRGWMSGGVSLISGEVILFRLINPPALPPYIRVVSVNVITGQFREIARLRSDFPEVWAGWDLFGTKVAVADDMNRLRILSLDGSYERLDTEVKGLYSSWDPRGGQIFFGGHFVREDGSEPVALFPDAIESAAFFSPEGDRLAVAVDGTLWLFENVEAAPGVSGADVEGLKEKVSALVELYREGLINAEDLSERLDVLRRPAGVRDETP